MTGIFCGVTPCNLIDFDQDLRENNRLDNQSRRVMMISVGASETSTYLYNSNIRGIYKTFFHRLKIFFEHFCHSNIL